MQTLGGTVSVAANSTSANVLAGEAAALLTGPTMGRVAAVSPNGTAAGGILMQLESGVRRHGRNVPINPASANGVITDPDDYIFRAVVLSGLVDLRFTNTTAGAIVVTWRVDIDI